MKATEDFALYHASNWRISYMKMMAQEWGWSKERIEELDQRPNWKIKRVKESHNNLVNFFDDELSKSGGFCTQTQN